MSETNQNLFGPEGPWIEAPLLLKFLIKRCDEMLATKNPKLPTMFQALSICAAAYDDEGYAELKNILFPESQVQRCRDIFVQILARTEEGNRS